VKSKSGLRVWFVDEEAVPFVVGLCLRSVFRRLGVGPEACDEFRLKFNFVLMTGGSSPSVLVPGWSFSADMAGSVDGCWRRGDCVSADRDNSDKTLHATDKAKMKETSTKVKVSKI
jgi:hypothetical protein